MWTRRQFLRLGGAAAAALPFLPLFRGQQAMANGDDGCPKRLVIVHWPQGTVMRQWLPTGDEHNFVLPYITAPLEDYRDRLIFLSGIDNVMPRYNEVGNAHINANYTVFTGQPFHEQTPTRLSAAGPSIEQVIGERMVSQSPFPRLDFAIGGQQTGSGLVTPNEGSFFWTGPHDPMAYFNDPLRTLLRVFGDNTVDPNDAWALQARRSVVLDGVLDNFRLLRRRLPAEDRERLEAHEAKLQQLEARISNGVGQCTAPSLVAPQGFRPGIDDHISAPMFNDILTTALACDLTRVATLTFANGHAPEFPWLWARNGGPIVDLNLWENWHAVVHADYQPGMEHPYRWYHEIFADLLARMSATEDADGDNLLDTSLVVFMSEYSSGRHWNNSLPIILAGNVPGAQMNRWVDYMDGGIDNLEARNGYVQSGVTTNQLWTSILHAFGHNDETFGLQDDALPTGPLPGLVG